MPNPPATAVLVSQQEGVGKPYRVATSDHLLILSRRKPQTPLMGLITVAN